MKILSTAIAIALASASFAEETITYDTDQSFDDVIFGLESAILDRGLVIDSVSHVGEMLERTREDVGSDVVLYEAADALSFCSSTLSRKVMEADVMNIMYCPYDIIVMVRADTPDVTTIGFRAFPEGPMNEVEALLDEISREAIGLD